jgi:ABC-2 type transport system permease protein
MLRVLGANIEEVFREAAARWTLLAYFFLSTLFIVIFAAAVNLDIVDGALAGAKLFGKEIQFGAEQVDLDKLVLGFESGFSAFLYLVGTFLAVFATAHLVPRLQEKGTIDLYLSKPVSRAQLLVSRYLAGLLLAAANIAYLIGSIWIILIWKTGVVHPRFLLAGGIILFVISTLLAFSFLIGVVTSSTAVAIMTSYSIFFISALLAAHDKIEAAMSSNFWAGVIHTLYWIFPKTSELGAGVIAFVYGEGAPERMTENITAMSYVSTGLFGVGCLLLAAVLFHRKEF